MKTIFLLLSGLFLFQINVSSQSNFPTERTKNDYAEIIRLYPDYLVSHLPKSINNEEFANPGLLFPRGRYLNYIHLMIPYDNKMIGQIKKESALKAKGIYHFGDSCLILPYNYEKFKIIKSDSIRNISFANMLPIPNIHSWLYEFPPEFYKEAVIYLLDAEKGRFLPDEYLSKSGVGLPKEWLHGYTKGLVFYKNFVIYWLEVW